MLLSPGMNMTLAAIAAALALAAAGPAVARPIEELARDPRVVVGVTVIPATVEADAERTAAAERTVNGESDGAGAPARVESIRLATCPPALRPASERGQ